MSDSQTYGKPTASIPQSPIDLNFLAHLLLFYNDVSLYLTFPVVLKKLRTTNFVSIGNTCFFIKFFETLRLCRRVTFLPSFPDLPALDSDRGIGESSLFLDCPVKPDNDKHCCFSPETLRQSRRVFH
jgi:hypothetical protein